ncbi:MAG: hypothetical protein MH825_14665 [Cyanobacteria bacterium]|nr:hypothetical protein [Cyanobacteriota bacterium]
MLRPQPKTEADWQLADVLLQPALIRTVDNIRKQLEASDWRGRYEESWVFPPGTPEETQMRVKLLQQQLTAAQPEEAAAIEEALAALPAPSPAYQFHLSRGDRSTSIDLWQLCFRICFRDYAARAALANGAIVEVEIDRDLLDETTGEVDWHRLDQKSQEAVQAIFALLGDPSATATSIPPEPGEG